MIIKLIAFGNENEAFVEDRLSDGVNIIFSDDNNRGKTIVFQGVMYSLGYLSIFPSSFPYRQYYFYSKVEIGGIDYEFLRKNNSTIVRSNTSYQIFNSVSEFKYFFDKEIYQLPRIEKDNKVRTVGFELFYELFFIGQDNRSPSNLISKGAFNKYDFKSMITSMAGLSVNNLSNSTEEEIRDKLKNKKNDLKSTRKKMSIMKANPDVAEIASKTYNQEEYQRKQKAISLINTTISELTKNRNREFNRKCKFERLISELKSLNQQIDTGKVHCAECGSTKIVFSNNEFNFDVSNKTVRNSILNSIQKNILQKEELLLDLDNEIQLAQDNLFEELSKLPKKYNEVSIYQEQIRNDRSFDAEAAELIREIKELEETKLELGNKIETNKKEQKALNDKIVKDMNDFYRAIDENSSLSFHDLFSKRDATFSGSEGQEYYFCRLMALNDALSHEFPLIVDSFRDGELSTSKEDKMLKFYIDSGKQVILSATLKKEEYESEKYSVREDLNGIDYSEHQDCKILNAKDAVSFKSILSSYNGLI